MNFGPTMLLAVAWCIRRGRRHIAFTDSWGVPERDLSFVHRLARRWVFRHSHAFLGPSRHTLAFYRSYGCPKDALFLTPLCINNAAAFAVHLDKERTFDVMYCGQFNERKMPLFFADVCRLISYEKPNLRVLLLGDGPLRERVLYELKTNCIDFSYAGFRKQSELPEFYASAKLLLFTSRQDPWGIVANEACAAGTPVIISRNAGAADELVVDCYNGFVCDCEPPLPNNWPLTSWCSNAMTLLNQPWLWQKFSVAARAKVQEFTYDKAAEGIIKAIDYATR